MNMKLKKLLKVIVLSLLLLFVFIAATEGPKSGGTFSNDSSNSGDFAWVNPSNAGSSDDVYATVTENFAGLSHYLKATNFNFSSVSGTVDGIVVEVEKKRITGTGYDGEVLLVKNGTIQGNNLGTTDLWPLTESYVTYGSTIEKWGLTWTASDITASNFGVVISYQGETATSAKIDHIRITVYYTVALTGKHYRIFGDAGNIEELRR